MPGGWPPWWQLTLAVCGVLTLLFPWFADAALYRLDSNHPWPEQRVRDVTDTISFVRATLGLLTMAYFFWLALHRIIPGLAR